MHYGTSLLEFENVLSYTIFNDFANTLVPHQFNKEQ